jgi:hypothetical protein
VVIQLVEANEKDAERRAKILEEISSMLQGLNLQSLDTKSRELFASKFTNFKSFLYAISQ